MRAREVRRVFEARTRLYADRVVVFLAPGAGAYAVVAARRIGGAVDRNRARRILREAWRQASPQVMNRYDVVLVARETIRGARTQDLVAEMVKMFREEELDRA